jgi:hypothetical protein
MIVYVLFVHKKSVSKRKVCIIFIKNKKVKKTPKDIFSGFLGGFFWVGFFGLGFFIANPAFSLSRSRDLERPPLPPRRRSRDRDRERDLSRRFFDFLDRLPERDRLPPRRRSLGERERRRSFL